MKLCLIFSVFIFTGLSILLFYAVPESNAHCDIDSKAYIQRGTFFAHTNKFVGSEEQQQPYYALGYALIIGVLYKLFGESLTLIIVFQLLIAFVSGFLMMRIARRLFSNRAATIVCCLFSINVGYLVFVQFVLTEIILSFFLLFCFERLVSFCYDDAQLPMLAQSALVLGCSIIIKPAALYFVFPVCCLLLMFSKKGALVQAFVFVFFFYVPVIGYMTYNYHAFDNFCVSRLDRVNIYYWFYPNVLAAQHGTTSDSERLKLLALSNGGHDFNVVGPIFWNHLKKEPKIFIRVWLTNVFKTWVGLYTTNLKVLVEPCVHGGSISYFKMQGNLWQKSWNYISAGATHAWIKAVGIYEAIWIVIRYVLCLCAVWDLLWRREYFWLLMICAFIGYFSLITGHDGCARFRMMFEFLLIILAAGGLDSLTQKTELYPKIFQDKEAFL